MPETLKYLARTTHRMALVVATAVTVTIPATIHHLSMEDLENTLEFKARVKASALSGVIASNPETWRYAENRLQGLISRDPVPLTEENVVVVDNDGEVLTEVGKKPGLPVVSASHALYDAGQEVGRVIVSASSHHLMDHTLVMALASLLLGIAVYIGVKTLPLRALQLATTSQQVAEAALAEKVERERQLQEAQALAHLGSYNWIPATDYLYWSDEHFRLWGLAPKSVRPDLALFINGIHPDDRERVKELLEKALRGESVYECDHRVIWPDGSVRHIHGRGTVSFDPSGKPERMIGTVTDITDFKRIESELQALNSQLESRVTQRTHALEHALSLTQATLDSTENGILVIDENRRVTTFNRRFGEMWHIPDALLEAGKDEEMLGYAIEQLVSPVQFIQKVEELYANPGTSSYDVIEFKDGRVFERYSQPQYINDQVVGRVWSFLDITERRMAEENLRNVMVELEKARAAAEASSEAKGVFLANMSHEIRTPLNGVIGLARIGMRENIGRKTGETCQRILEAGEHLLRVVNDILDFSKIEAGKLDIEARDFRLSAVIEQSISMVIDVARAKGIDLIYDDTGDPPAPIFVCGDPLRLGQILLNLLNNAVKFTKQGEVRLSIDRDGNSLAFRIRDTGMGISPEQLTRLFHPFEQADKSTTRKFGGSGLGLVISRRLAELMGGDISVESELGRGSTFTLRLSMPEAESVVEEVPQVPVEHGKRLAGLHILAAEDVEINRLVLEDLLRSEGASVTLVRDGIQAVGKFAAREGTVFAAVLMDIQMPYMNGYEATQLIHKLDPSVPVIGLTAHAMAEERMRCLDAGMVAHVTKPIDPDTLVEAIRQHCVPAVPSTVETSVHSPTAPVADMPKLIDWKALSARYRNRQDFIDKLLAAIIRDHGDIPDKLTCAIDALDFQSVAFLAHAIKGIAGNIEARLMQAAAKQTEERARSGEPDAFIHGRELARLFAQVLDALSSHLA